MPTSDVIRPWGCVVGRFQPFHNDHLSLVKTVYSARGRVIVAVTNADPTWGVPVSEAPHRHQDDANPLTYWQRMELIRAALRGIVPTGSYRIVPFPIHDPTRWGHYLPAQTHCWVRSRGEWEERKLRDLATRFEVQATPVTNPTPVSGTAVRAALVTGNPAWEADVPGPVARLLKRWMIDGTLDLHAGRADDSQPTP